MAAWLASALPADDMVYKEKMAFADSHEIVVQDFVHPGGDTGDIDAAGAEQDMAAMDKAREMNTSFAETPVVCQPSYFEDEEGNIREEYRQMMECPLCKPEPTRTQVAAHETRKFSFKRRHISAINWRKTGPNCTDMDDLSNGGTEEGKS